jgi:hypothetical protein
VLKLGLPDWVSPACGRTGPSAPANPTGNPNFNLKNRPYRKKVGTTKNEKSKSGSAKKLRQLLEKLQQLLEK